MSSFKCRFPVLSYEGHCGPVSRMALSQWWCADFYNLEDGVFSLKHALFFFGNEWIVIFVSSAYIFSLMIKKGGHDDVLWPLWSSQ